EKDLIVIVELPGVEKENIRISAKKNKLYILASSERRRYKKVIPLPNAIDISSLKSEYRNGILEIKLNKV
ncbi:MAG: Hsp20/alpha crystallin family protein, partial [Nitrososphaeria archaeon]|nr:Hsp20/alpha crystallin family protein [Nitrososphaeria archaeon]